MIPVRNLENLMLNEEVVKAVEAGQFHIWAINTVDEGISLMTGIAPGERLEDGSYPENTFYRAVFKHLDDFAKADERWRHEEYEKEKEEEEGIAGAEQDVEDLTDQHASRGSIDSKLPEQDSDEPENWLIFLFRFFELDKVAEKWQKLRSWLRGKMG